jgi:hypothetical protein
MVQEEGLAMGKKASCSNTEYTNGFQITRQSDGTFVAIKGKERLQARSAAELRDLIEKNRQLKK